MEERFLDLRQAGLFAGHLGTLIDGKLRGSSLSRMRMSISTFPAL